MEILELLPALNSLKLRARAGWELAATGQITPVIPDSPFDYVLQTKEPVVIENSSSEDRFADLDLLQQQGVVSSSNLINCQF